MTNPINPNSRSVQDGDTTKIRGMTGAHRELPILFSGAMVRAILAGRKTQTRRILKPQPTGDINKWLHDHSPARWNIGDHLWVRERFSGEWPDDTKPPGQWDRGSPIWYWADGDPVEGDWTRPKPSIHMPRWASRITLSVKAVRVERLHDITTGGIAAEGKDHRAFRGQGPAFDQWMVNEFASLWDAINGPGAWDANPWVSVTTFRRIGHD